MGEKGPGECDTQRLKPCGEYKQLDSQICGEESTGTCICATIGSIRHRIKFSLPFPSPPRLQFLCGIGSICTTHIYCLSRCAITLNPGEGICSSCTFSLSRLWVRLQVWSVPCRLKSVSEFHSPGHSHWFRNGHVATAFQWEEVSGHLCISSDKETFWMRHVHES